MTQMNERIDFTEPPPGYKIWISMGNSGWAVDGLRVADDIRSAWAHYKANHDPPGLWCNAHGFGYVGKPGYIEVIEDTDLAVSRANAWRWYEEQA